jgi:hypothetical protein
MSAAYRHNIAPPSAAVQTTTALILRDMKLRGIRSTELFKVYDLPNWGRVRRTTFIRELQNCNFPGINPGDGQLDALADAYSGACVDLTTPLMLRANNCRLRVVGAETGDRAIAHARVRLTLPPQTWSRTRTAASSCGRPFATWWRAQGTPAAVRWSASGPCRTWAARSWTQPVQPPPPRWT